MDKIFGFIGTGNMGGALARAARKKLAPEQLILANRTPEKAARLSIEIGGRVADNHTVAAEADVIFLGVKPQGMEAMLQDLWPTLMLREQKTLLVSMAAGISIEQLEKWSGGDWPVMRIMPNTPCSIGEGVILYTAGPGVTEEEIAPVLDALSGAGRFVPLPEALFSAGSAVSGCGPAFVQLFLEGLADGGVACGLPRAAAQELAAQMAAGSAKLLLETGEHPGRLKDAVCSPGGTTIQGVRALERAGFRGSAMEAVIAAYERDRSMG